MDIEQQRQPPTRLGICWLEEKRVHLGSVLALRREVFDARELELREQRIVLVRDAPQRRRTGAVEREDLGGAIARREQHGHPSIGDDAEAGDGPLAVDHALDRAVADTNAREMLGAIIGLGGQHRGAVARESQRGDGTIERGAHHASRRATVARDDGEPAEIVGRVLPFIAAREGDPLPVRAPRGTSPIVAEREPLRYCGATGVHHEDM